MTEQTTEMTAEAEIQPEAIDDSSTSTEAQPELNSEAGNQASENEPDWFKGRIDKVTSQKYEYKAQAEAAEQRAQELERQLAAQATVETKAPTPVQVTLPDSDLQYDDPEKFKADTEAYYRQVAAQEFNSREQAALEAEKLRAAEDNRRVAAENTQKSIVESAERSGLDFADVDKSAGILVSRGMDHSLTQGVLEHENSAALIVHLTQNPSDFDDINGLQGLQLYRKLDELSPKAIQRKISSAPEPVKGLTGLSAKEPDEFSRRCPGAQFV